MKLKSVTLAASCIALSCAANAQFKLPTLKNAAPTVNNALRGDIQKVVADCPNQFNSIKGEISEKNPQTVEYQSLLMATGAEACGITEYSYSQTPVYSWQALMLSTEDFEEAAKKYKSIFNQLKGTNVAFDATRNYFMQGTYEEPDENKKFTNSVFNLSTRQEPMNKIKIEVNMQFEFPEWKVNILVYEKERDDDERGKVFDN